MLLSVTLSGTVKTLWLTNASVLATTIGLAADGAGEKSGLPQFDVSTFEPQISWLILSLVVFYIIISRFVLPGVGEVMESREERISGDIDKADQDRQQADKIKDAYEAGLVEARSKAQSVIGDMKAKAAAKFASEAKKLDDKLTAQAADADARIANAKSDALAEVEPIAREAVSDIIARLSGVDAEGEAVEKAIKAAMAEKAGA